MYWLSKKDKFSIYSHAIFSVFHCLPAIKGRRYVCELSIGTAKCVINRFFTAQFFSCHFCIQYIVIQDWWTKCSCGRKRSDKLWNFWWLETAIPRHWTTHSIYFYSLLSSYALKNILCYFHFIAVFSQPQCVAAIFFSALCPVTRSDFACFFLYSIFFVRCGLYRAVLSGGIIWRISFSVFFSVSDTILCSYSGFFVRQFTPHIESMLMCMQSN